MMSVKSMPVGRDADTDVKTAVATRPELDYEGLAAIACGHSAFRLLMAGVELNLFTILSQRGALSRAAISEALSLDAQPTRILLNGLVALRLLRRDGAMYKNAAVSERHLVVGGPHCQIAILGWQRDIVYPGLQDFTESLRQNRNVGLRRFHGSGDTLYERLSADPALEKVFQQAMSALSTQANHALAATIDLSGTRHLVDLGGGDGTNAINLARRFPHLRITVFDRESVLGSTREAVARAGLSDRIATAAGDFLRDPLPRDADAMLLAHIVTIWSPEHNDTLFRKCRAALAPGGRLLVFGMVSYDDESGPLINALGSPYFQAIATGEGMLYTGGEIAEWLRDAGFVVERAALPMEHALFTARKQP
jgi:L-tyrosine C(3)-methyltransferase